MVENRYNFLQLNPEFTFNAITRSKNPLELWRALRERHFWLRSGKGVYFYHRKLSYFPTLSFVLRSNCIYLIFLLDLVNFGFQIGFSLCASVLLPFYSMFVVFIPQRSRSQCMFILFSGVINLYLVFSALIWFMILIKSLITLAYVTFCFFKEANTRLRLHLMAVRSMRGHQTVLTNRLLLNSHWIKYQNEHHRLSVLSQRVNSYIVSPLFSGLIIITVGFTVYLTTLVLVLPWNYFDLATRFLLLFIIHLSITLVRCYSSILKIKAIAPINQLSKLGSFP